MTITQSTIGKVAAIAVAVLIVAGMLFAYAAPQAHAQTALTETQIQAILSLLTSFGAEASIVANVEASLRGTSTTGGGTTPATGACTFTRSLTIGSQGADVTCLQQYLTGTGHFTFSGGATGFFGPITQTAVAAWQAANGVAPSVGFFGPISQAKYNQLTAGTGAGTGTGTGTGTDTTGGTTAGVEGSLTVTLEGAPSNGTDVEKGETKNVIAIKVDADESDMTVNRVDFNFNVRPWLYLSSVALLDGSTVVKEMTGLTSSDFTEITSGSDYRLRLGGLDVVVPKGTNKVLTLRVTAHSITDKTATTITINTNANAVRATDTKGLQHEEPNSALTARTFDFKDNTTGNIKATLDANSPETRNVVVTTTGTTENVELMRFELEAEHQEIDVNSLIFAVGTSATDAPTLLDEVWLADSNGNRLASASTVSTTTTFSTTDLDDVDGMKVPGGSKKTFRLMATIADADDITSGSGASTTLTANTTNIVAEDGDFDTATVTSSTVVGNDLFFYQAAANFSSLSASATSVENTPYLADVTMVFTITASGGDVFISKTPATALSTSTTASAASLVAVTASGSTSGDTSGAYKIGSGASRSFTFTGSMDNQNGSSAGSKEFKITQINWGDDSTNVTEFNTSFDLEDLEVNKTLTTS